MHEIKLTCPYCLCAITVLLDLGVYDFVEIIDDCEVCCRPIEITYSVEDNEIESFSYNKMQGNDF